MCDHALLSRYIDGELDLGARKALNQHLRQCGQCSLDLAELRSMDNVLRSWGARRSPVSPAADIRIVRTVRRRREAARIKRFFAVGRMTPAAVGSSIAALLVLLTVNLHGIIQTPSASETAWAHQQSSIKRQAAPLLAARRSSAILGGQTRALPQPQGRHAISSELN